MSFRCRAHGKSKASPPAFRGCEAQRDVGKALGAQQRAGACLSPSPPAASGSEHWPLDWEVPEERGSVVPQDLRESTCFWAVRVEVCFQGPGSAPGREGIASTLSL